MAGITSITFDSFDFVAHGLVITNFDHLTLPSRNNQLETLANEDGALLVQSQLGTKPIIIEGYYTGSSVADAQNMYDTLAQALNRQQRPLIVPHAGAKRTYIATPQNVILKQPDGLNRLTFSFEFVVPKGSSIESDRTTIINTTNTLPVATIPFTILGSVTARPLITMTFNIIVGGTSKTVTIRNAKDFIGLTLQRTWLTGDTLSIDSANFQIYINGVLTVPSGRMPTWSPGTGSLYYGDTFTSRSVSISASYQQSNL